MAGRTVMVVAALVFALPPTVDAKPLQRIVHVHARTVIVYGDYATTPSGAYRIVSPRQDEIIFIHRKSQRPTRAAQIACEMGPHFLGAAWRGKRYRPYTRTGRSRICNAPLG